MFRFEKPKKKAENSGEAEQWRSREAKKRKMRKQGKAEKQKSKEAEKQMFKEKTKHNKTGKKKSKKIALLSHTSSSWLGIQLFQEGIAIQNFQFSLHTCSQLGRTASHRAQFDPGPSWLFWLCRRPLTIHVLLRHVRDHTTTC